MQWIREYDPDVIWLHNIHGYYLNVEVLFDYLKAAALSHQMDTARLLVLYGSLCLFFGGGLRTMEDRLPQMPAAGYLPGLQGHQQCGTQLRPQRAAFTGVPDMQLITPSKWLVDLVKQSYLREYPVEVVYNTIDKTIFADPSNFREKYGPDR